MSAEAAAKHAIAVVRAAKMPVGYLDFVVKNYTVTNGPKNRTDTTFNRIKFDSSTISRLASLSSTKLGSSSAVGSLYHEFAHAYIDKKENEQPVKKMLNSAESYYKGSTLTEEVTQRTKTCKDGKEVAEEAATSYVDHVTAAWWEAYSMLSRIYWVILPKNRSSEHFAHCAKYGALAVNGFTKAMKGRVFGYEFDGNAAYRTNKSLHPAVKSFVMTTLLQGMISTTFSQNKPLHLLSTALQKKLASLGYSPSIQGRDHKHFRIPSAR